MGMDMYVNGKRYLWDFGEDGDKQVSASISKFFPELGDRRVKQVEAEFMYWRKANAIHQWFVDNVQEGNDDCGEYHLTEEHLVALRDACQSVINDPDNAEKYLPAHGGFFFGSTEYDEYYFEYVKQTLEWLNTLLFVNKFDEKLEDWNLYYQSSW